MLASVLAVVLVAAPVRAAPVPPASASAATTAPAATRPAPPAEQLHALHVQAYQLMRDEKFDKATPLIEQVYRSVAVPPAQRPRALVINHAILDLVQRVNVMRAVRDLTDYLAGRDEPDELATNVLGSALDLAGRNPRFASTPLFASAQNVLQRHDKLLEASQPGLRRWGTRWLTPRERERLEAEQREADRRIAEVQGVVEQLNTLIAQQYENAAEYDRQMTEYQHAEEGSVEGQWWYDARRGAATARRKAVELTAGRDYDLQMIDHLKRTFVPRPTWPTRYPPVEPDS